MIKYQQWTGVMPRKWICGGRVSPGDQTGLPAASLPYTCPFRTEHRILLTLSGREKPSGFFDNRLEGIIARRNQCYTYFGLE